MSYILSSAAGSGLSMRQFLGDNLPFSSESSVLLRLRRETLTGTRYVILTHSLVQYYHASHGVFPHTGHTDVIGFCGRYNNPFDNR